MSVDVAIWRTPEAREALASQDIGAVYRLLQDAGYSQRQIAQCTGQLQCEISEIIAGRRVRSVEVLRRIAVGLGVPLPAIGLAHTVTASSEEQPRATVLGLPRRALRPAANHCAPWTGADVAALRGALRMSLREFAAYLGVCDRMVSKWEVAGASIQPRPVNQAALDTALRRAPAEVQARFAAWPDGGRADRAEMIEGAGWVAHVVLNVPNLAAALELAEELTRAVAHVPAVDIGETTVSREDHQSERFRVYCGRLLRDLPGRVRCALRYGHAGDCAEH